MRLIFLISFLFTIIVSLNLYKKRSNCNQEYEICYYTIKKPEDTYIVRLKKMKHSEIKNKIAEKARLPFNGH